MNEPSGPSIDPCLLPVIPLANAWMKSKMKEKIIIPQLSPHLQFSLLLHRKKLWEFPLLSLACNPFTYSLCKPLLISCFAFTIYFYYSFVASRCLMWYALVLLLPFSLGRRGRKDERLKLICFSDKAVKKHVGPSEHFNSLSPLLIFLRREWKPNVQNCQHIHILFWKLKTETNYNGSHSPIMLLI